MGLSVKDILDFARAGWKPADVKDILNQASELEAKTTEETAAITPKEEMQPEPEKAAATGEDKEETELDELKKQLAEKDALIKKIQHDNSSRELQKQETKTSQETLNDIVRDFM